jgi:hypothetical protein
MPILSATKDRCSSPVSSKTWSPQRINDVRTAERAVTAELCCATTKKIKLHEGGLRGIPPFAKNAKGGPPATSRFLGTPSPLRGYGRLGMARRRELRMEDSKTISRSKAGGQSLP